MDTLAREYRAINGGGCDSNEDFKSHALLIIKLPELLRVLRIISRWFLFAMLLLALFSIGRVVSGASSSAATRDFHGFKIQPALIHDLVEEGLIKKGHKGFVLGDIDCDFDFLRENDIDLLTREMKVVEHQVFDFVFAPGNFLLIDDILKDGGLVISQLGYDTINQLKNYKIVYLRRFENTVVAMRKTGKSSKTTRKQKRVFYGVASDEQKKAALKELEDVYLEPPRRATLAKKSRKIKFLPDLLKDSLGGYPRRAFVSDDSSALDWFYKNYPMRDQEFQVYDVGSDDKLSESGISQLENRKDEGSDVHEETGVSGWLVKHVRREDYVVMKAEARVVEEMLKDKTLNLVDELFLECKHQWQHGGKENGSKRAYWECLALYGEVRDEGIAVHQWWG